MGQPKTVGVQDMQVRTARAQDAAGIARLCVDNGRDPWPAEAILSTADKLVVVAVAGAQLVGIAKTHWHEDAHGIAPAGHYLGGVIVDSSWRRYGIGQALTSARLAWIAARSQRAYYFTNKRNDSSLRLHAKFGFVQIAASEEIRTVRADDGDSKLVLFEAIL
ncbi:GNAT family N-acetyltransferase [Glutamicibacter arilaitensis]|uniref:GNAT family N-acetyltransferase n=1 Tax=Glutamicibacter arilaitensis TaxID=256701 RepID=UPI00384A7DCF